MATLTVGTGQAYTTIAAAVAAAKDGDVVKVTAGTYYNDFITVNTKITIQGVGGLAKIVATVSPPNGKAIITTNTDVTLDSLELTGAKVSDLNGAGVRYQGGNLVIKNSYIHDNQEGILAADDPNGSITIDKSEFAYNGSNGYAHNIYIGNVGTTVMTNSYVHDAVGGGVEFRSRGANTTLLNNRIDDNSSTANYTIDVPNGGKVLISGNVIQKTANAQNRAIIHFGGTTGSFQANSSLTITNNTIISDFDSTRVRGVLNQSNINGYPVTAQITNNTIYNIPAAQMVDGTGNVTGSKYLTTRPALDTSHPWSTSTTSSTGSTGTGTTTPGTGTGTTTDTTTGTENGTGTTTGTGTTGTGSTGTSTSNDTLVLHLATPVATISPSFTVSIDGKVLTSSPTYLLASSVSSTSRDFSFTGNFGGSGSHQVTINFVNDGYGTASSRQLLVKGIDYDGAGQSGVSSTLYVGQKATFTVVGHTS